MISFELLLCACFFLAYPYYSLFAKISVMCMIKLPRHAAFRTLIDIAIVFRKKWKGLYPNMNLFELISW